MSMLKINVGGNDDIRNSNGTWIDDSEFVTQFDGGVSDNTGSIPEGDPDDMVPSWVFNTARVGSCQWVIPIPDNLIESDWLDIMLWFYPISPNTEPGQYTFGLAVDGGIQEDSLDVVALAGKSNSPVGISVPVRLNHDANVVIDTYSGPSGDLPYLNSVIIAPSVDPLNLLSPDSDLDEIREAINYLLSLERTRRETA
jgi:hypothetical protein